MASIRMMGKHEMQEPTYFGAEEATSDPCGPRELSATPFKGSHEFPWLTWVKGVLPSPDVRGKESGKWPWELQDSDRGLRVGDPDVAAAVVRGKTGRQARSGHGTVRGRARWTPKRRIYTSTGRPERAKA
ncbi:hypothetical protein CRG98_026929 [Punica granatum]|uniref:Uncharacterized protein n=1 Tax=Punica granatum TaxID=22663 RepID=A0A2I0J9X6_PUNGR|nr:hypothetical protein CRG98_026929 [Punica granatum]